MANVYTLYKQICAPTAIELSVYCNFIDVAEKCLVIAGVNQLHIYKVDYNSGPDSATQVGSVGVKVDKTGSSRRARLECFASFSLFGNIVSMQPVRLSTSSYDALLLSFRDAKISLVEYDHSTHDIKTLSMHCFEYDEELKDGRCQHSTNIPMMRVDTDSRCAGLLIYGRRLIILPFRRDIPGTESVMAGTSAGQQTQVMSSYVIDLQKMDDKIVNVLDFQFLHGYHEPTIAILHEPLPTWPGRIAIRKDTCSMIAISLNLDEKVHPVIWSMDNLPFDCEQIQAVPKPIGGMLLLAVNSLVYLNQSFPPFGVSLNSLANYSTDSTMLKCQDGAKLTLDCAQSCFITFDKLVISLRGGELYVLTLITDAMRAVRSFHLDRAAASVLTTSICECGKGYIFLGSRLGNSLLLKYTEKTAEISSATTAAVDSGPQSSTNLVDTAGSAEDGNTDEPEAKKRKEMLNWISSVDMSFVDDLDELEVYGSDIQQSEENPITQYTFEVCDSLVNIGPCSQMVIGEPACLSEEFSGLEDLDMELVTTSGYGKNGAISVLQRSIRPQVVTTFELPGCRDMWTVVGATNNQQQQQSNQTDDDSDETQAHTLLILSQNDSTMILKTGQEIMELDQSGFNTQGPTLYAGNIGNNRYTIQVSATSIRLLDGVKQLQNVPVDINHPIVCCSVADPYVVTMSQGGEQIVVLTLKTEVYGSMTTPRLVATRPLYHKASPVTTLCAYCDVSQMFVVTSHRKTLITSKPAEPSLDLPFNIASKTLDVDDEDELLYGGGSDNADVPSSTVREVTPAKPTSEANITAQSMTGLSGATDEHKSTYWVALCRQNGDLEIFSLPEFRLYFHGKNFRVGHKLLTDFADLAQQMPAGVIDPDGSRTPSAAASLTSLPGLNLLAGDNSMDHLDVKEILLVGLGQNKLRPHLMARVNEELYIYEAFPYHTADTHVSLKIRFRKIPHGLILKTKKQTGQSKETNKMGEGEETKSTVRWLRPFDDISGYAGVFVCGPCPHWLLMTSHGVLRCHSMSIDGTVTCFTPFHNVNCPKGFLYFNKQGELRISVLPTHLSYDAPWPVRKVPLRCTAYYVAYHPDSKTYTVVTSLTETTNKLVICVGDGEKQFETVERDDRFVLPTIERFNMQLFSPISWEPIPNSRYECEEYERVTCMQTVNLRSEGTVSGRKNFVVCGTIYAYNEDIASKGRIIILDVIDVVPEPGQPLTRNKFKVVYDKEQKGPISAIEAVQGFLITAIGQKIYIWQLEDESLRGVAFIDAQIYVHQISAIKNLIMIGDIFKSITLLRYQEDMKILSHVSKDTKPSQVYSIAYLVDNKKLNFLVSDRQKNLLVYTYQPELKESCGGQRLTLTGMINIGSHVTSFFRVRCKQLDPSTDRKAYTNLRDRHITYFATLDGSIGYLSPISEYTFRRLQMLQNTLNNHIAHTAGLNPKGYRMAHLNDQLLTVHHKNIVDGDLLWKFLNLSMIERAEISRRIGASQEQLLSDLLDVDRTTAHF